MEVHAANLCNPTTTITVIEAKSHSNTNIWFLLPWKYVKIPRGRRERRHTAVSLVM
jgi:hypothetical protein